MYLLLALSAVAASPPHAIVKAFDVTLGKPAGDMPSRGFRKNEFGGTNSWVRTDDKFFDRITVDISATLSLVETITASKRYSYGDRDLKQNRCNADLESVAASIRRKYPTLKRPSWHKSDDGMSGMLGYYRKYIFEEPSPRQTNPSSSRYIRLVCTGPSVLAKKGDQNRPATLLVSYQISEKEHVPIERAFRDEEQHRERTRARAIGIDPEKL